MAVFVGVEIPNFKKLSVFLECPIDFCDFVE